MKKIYLLIITFGLLHAGSVQEGKVHYLEAKCQKCHLQDAKYDPNSINKKGLVSKVTDIKSLKKWVASCDNYFDIGWFPEEQEAVSQYLNSVYYHYKEEK